MFQWAAPRSIRQTDTAKPRSITPATAIFTARVLFRFEPSMALVRRQLLPASGIMEVMPNTPFRMLLTNVSNQHVHVPEDMMVGHLCNNLTATGYITQLPTTLTEDLSLAEAVSVVQNDNEDTSSPIGFEVQASNSSHNSVYVSDDYAAYRDDFIRMLEPLK